MASLDFEFRGKSVDRHLTISDPESAVATALSCFQQVSILLTMLGRGKPRGILGYYGEILDGFWKSPIIQFPYSLCLNNSLCLHKPVSVHCSVHV